MEPASWKDSRLCIKFRITAKKQKEETQAIPATPDSPIATGLQYFLVRNMRMGRFSVIRSHQISLLDPFQVPSDRRNIHYWTWYLHKIPPEGVNVYNRLYEPIPHINNFVYRIIEESNIVKSGLTNVIRLTKGQIRPWIRYAKREKRFQLSTSS